MVLRSIRAYSHLGKYVGIKERLLLIKTRHSERNESRFFHYCVNLPFFPLSLIEDLDGLCQSLPSPTQVLCQEWETTPRKISFGFRSLALKSKSWD